MVSWGDSGSLGIESVWIEPCSQLLGLDVVRNVLNRLDLWHAVKDVPLQLGREIRVRVTTGMRDRHPLAAGLSRLCRRSKEVPLADSEPDDFDAPLEVFPVACNLTAPVFFLSVEGFFSERPAKLVR